MKQSSRHQEILSVKELTSYVNLQFFAFQFLYKHIDNLGFIVISKLWVDYG